MYNCIKGVDSSYLKMFSTTKSFLYLQCFPEPVDRVLLKLFAEVMSDNEMMWTLFTPLLTPTSAISTKMMSLDGDTLLSVNSGERVSRISIRMFENIQIKLFAEPLLK